MRVPFEAMQGQGQSLEVTIDKERCLSSALAIGMKIINARCSCNTIYWHFDANAGCGHNDTADVPGSPIVFHTMADMHLKGIERRALFCDTNCKALEELCMQRLSPEHLRKSQPINCDNEEALKEFAKAIRKYNRPEYALGSIIIDPNGYWYRNKKGEGPPISGLPNFTKEFPCIDIILNLNIRAYRLIRRQRQVITPSNVLAGLNKSGWLVHLANHNRGRWLLAVGRNIGTNPHEKIGFYKLDSEEGQNIMNQVEGA